MFLEKLKGHTITRVCMSSVDYPLPEFDLNLTKILCVVVQSNF